MKLVKVYGAVECPDTIYALAQLKARELHFDFYNITGSMMFMKEFLKLRDGSSMFDGVRAAGGIGIPLFIFEDGSSTLDLKEALALVDGE